jgi:hypothetical protein
VNSEHQKKNDSFPENESQFDVKTTKTHFGRVFCFGKTKPHSKVGEFFFSFVVGGMIDGQGLILGGKRIFSSDNGK